MKSFLVKNNVLALSLFVLFLISFQSCLCFNSEISNKPNRTNQIGTNYRNSIGNKLFKNRQELSSCSIPKCKYPDKNCEVCLKCAEGFDTLYNLDNSLSNKQLCYPVISDCSFYNKDGSCKECQKGSTLLTIDGKGNCQKCKAANSNLTSCTECDESQNLFLIKGKCMKFDNCLKLDKNNQCLECNESSFLNADSKKCYAKSKGCSNNIVLDEKVICTKCEEPYVNVENQCISKISNCTTHDFSKNNKDEKVLVCLVCDTNFEVSVDGKCVKSKCQEFSKGFCQKCIDEFELDEKTKICRKKIEKCVYQTDGICIKCEEGYEYSNFKCSKSSCKTFEDPKKALTLDETIKLRILKNKEKTYKKNLMVNKRIIEKINSLRVNPYRKVTRQETDKTVQEKTQDSSSKESSDKENKEKENTKDGDKKEVKKDDTFELKFNPGLIVMNRCVECNPGYLLDEMTKKCFKVSTYKKKELARRINSLDDELEIMSGSIKFSRTYDDSNVSSASSSTENNTNQSNLSSSPETSSQQASDTKVEDKKDSSVKVEQTSNTTESSPKSEASDTSVKGDIQVSVSAPETQKIAVDSPSSNTNQTSNESVNVEKVAEDKEVKSDKKDTQEQVKEVDKSNTNENVDIKKEINKKETKEEKTEKESEATILNCLQIKGNKCKACQTGFELNQMGMCTLKNCNIMLNENECFQCSLGFYLNKDKKSCIACSEFNYNSNESLPIECKICPHNHKVSYLYTKIKNETNLNIYEKMCSRIIKGCKTYSVDDLCGECLDGFIMSNNKEFCFDSQRIVNKKCFSMIDNILVIGEYNNDSKTCLMK